MRSQNGSLKDGFCVCLIRKDPNNPALHSGDLAAYGPTVQG